MLRNWMVVAAPTDAAKHVAVLVFTDAIVLIFGEMAGDAFAVSIGLSYRMTFERYPDAVEVLTEDGIWNSAVVGKLFAALGMD